MILVVAACARDDARPAPATVAPAAADGGVIPSNATLAANGEPVPAPYAGCAGGTAIRPSKLPWPIGVPPGAYAPAWCEPGDVSLDGPYVALHPAGKPAAVGTRHGGAPDGAWVYYYATGEKLLEGAFSVGVPIGLWRVYTPDGEILQLGCFVDGDKRWSTDDSTDTRRCP